MNAQTFALLYGLPFAALLLAAWRTAPAHTVVPVPTETRTLLLWLAAGILLRLPLLWDTGFHYDTGTYKAWALKLSDPANPFALYEDGYFADYPPLYMYILAAIGALARLTGLEGGTHFTALIKLPPLLCDLAVSWLLLRNFREQGLPRPMLLASLYWFNPAVLFDTALWGQSESLLILFLLLAWQAWRKDRLAVAALALAAAIAFKPQGGVFAGIFGLAVLISQPWRRSLAVAMTGSVAFAALILPFAWQQPGDWILKLYLSTASTYDYITVNAYNLWALLGWNWQKEVGHFIGLSAQVWAMLIAGGGLLAIGAATGVKLRDPAVDRSQLIAWSFALAALVFFVLAPRMHERYLLPIIPLLLLLARQRLALVLLAGWTGVCLANMATVYHYYIGLDQVPPGINPWIRLQSATVLLLFLMTIMSALRPAWLRRAARWTRLRLGAIQPKFVSIDVAREPWRRQHGMIVGGLVLIAVFLSTLKLGATTYPLSGIKGATLDLEYRYTTPVAAKDMLVFAGEGSAKISLLRHNGLGWEEVVADTDLESFFKLHRLPLSSVQAARRYRLKIAAEAGRINEVVLLDAAGEALQPNDFVPLRGTGRDAASPVLDEPKTWRDVRGYLHEPYFDEIYHARTAHEYLHGLPIYETTHPPLGKWLISLGISQFGMTPFGMRSAGVVASALLVGVLAWGAWLLVGSRRAMLIAGGLALFEFSRFSIGRYSTIDSFLILFIAASALCLWCAFTRQQWRDGWRLSLPLCLAGLCLGAAIATKWNALYFGIGVFLLYAYSLWPQGKPISIWWRDNRPRLLGASVALGLIPLAVYLLSYIPFLNCLDHRPSLFSGEGLAQVWKSQKDMYDYHAKLTSTHPFSAPFYTWPLLLKPLWLFIDDVPGARSSLTLLGNPLVCWGGLVTVLALVRQALRQVEREHVLILGSIAALYLPWLAVSRISFIYHYYPVIPFLILALSAWLARLDTGVSRQRWLPATAVVLAGLLFLWFYPAISGWPVSDAWARSLRWLPGWWML